MKLSVRVGVGTSPLAGDGLADGTFWELLSELDRWTEEQGEPPDDIVLWTCLLFAFGHSLVIFQWWHVFIIIPSLAFGWLRERTDGIVAGAFFHAWCNVAVTTLDTLYGIVPPST